MKIKSRTAFLILHRSFAIWKLLDSKDVSRVSAYKSKKLIQKTASQAHNFITKFHTSED